MFKPMRTTRRVKDLQGRPGWYRIKALADVPTQVTIYDEIGMLGVSADLFMRELADVPGDIELHLNSPGGDVHDGIAIYNQLRHRPGMVSVVVDGLAASAASFIAQAASPGKLAIAPHAQMMIHLGFGMGIGGAQDMRDYADLLDKASNNIAGIYADRTGKPAAYWLERMEAETWYDDHEAVAEGLADHILGQEKPQNSFDLSVYKHPRNADGRWDPDGDGDDDSTPEGDTDHDYWDEDGRQLKPVPGKPMPAQDRLEAKYNADEDDRKRMGDGWRVIRDEKYSADDRKRMAAAGHAMPDGSYPVGDEEDLNKAIHAVGRGGADHDAIRRHIIKRAKALGKSDAIPDNWNADGSTSNLSETDILAMFAGELQLDAGKE